MNNFFKDLLTRKLIIPRAIIGGIGILLALNMLALYTIMRPNFIFHILMILAISLIAYAILLPKIPKIVHITAAILISIPIIFSSFLMIYGNTSNIDHTEDVVIVLGAGVRGETVTRILAHRLETAADYWHENPNAYIVTTGGIGDRATISEAEAMARFLVELGVPREKILLEEHSTNTYENLKFAHDIIVEHMGEDFRAVIISNDFHLYRAGLIAREAGIYARRKGAPTDWYTWNINYTREMMAIINQWLFR